MYGSIESANIVGYAPAELQDGGLTAASAFVPVSGKTIDLLDMKVVGYDEATEGDVYVQTLDEFGRTANTYFYYDVPGELTGWLDAYDNEVESGDVTIQPGEGLWVVCPDEGYGLQSAGQVALADVMVVLQANGLSIVNPTPVNVDLTACVVTGYDEATEGDVYVQTLDEYGRTANTYFYYDVPGELTGWLDAFDNEVEEGDVVCAPGVGLWAVCPEDGFNFIWPGVTIAK